MFKVIETIVNLVNTHRYRICDKQQITSLYTSICNTSVKSHERKTLFSLNNPTHNAFNITARVWEKYKNEKYVKKANKYGCRGRNVNLTQFGQ